MTELNAQYKRDMDQNYLLLPVDNNLNTDAYPFRMLVSNIVPGLLKCRVTHVDGMRKVCYEITSKQPVSALFDHRQVSCPDLMTLFGGLIRMLEAAAEYLINPSMLVLLPDFIFVDTKRKEVSFCLLPGYDTEIRDQFRAFTEYLLPRLDHEDSRAVMLGYGLYRQALQDAFRLENIKETLYRNPEVQADDPPKPESGSSSPVSDSRGQTDPSSGQENLPTPDFSWTEESISPDQAADVISRRDQKEKAGKEAKGGFLSFLLSFLLPMALSVCLFLGLTLAKQYEVIPQISTETILFFAVVMLAAGVFAARLLSAGSKAVREKSAEEEAAPFPPFAQEPSLALNQEYEEKAAAADEREKPPSTPRLKVTEYAENEDYGETITLNSALVKGPASLVSREPGELAPVYLSEEIVILGKMPNAADIVIPVPTVSRIHAKIRHREDGYYLSDLNSRNGTSVNGKMLEANEEYLLHDQDEVDLGQARYLFLDPSASV